MYVKTNNEIHFQAERTGITHGLIKKVNFPMSKHDNHLFIELVS